MEFALSGAELRLPLEVTEASSSDRFVGIALCRFIHSDLGLLLLKLAVRVNASIRKTFGSCKLSSWQQSKRGRLIVPASLMEV
jgi:hypothetical protein